MQLIRSLLFHFVMVVSIVVYVPLLLLTAPLSFNTRYHAGILWGRFILLCLRYICGVDYRVEGRENIPDGAAVVLGKHQSTWETVSLPWIFSAPQVWVLKRELLWVPFFGWGLALMEPIAIDRNAGRKAIEQMVSQGRQRLDAGRWVVVFPEGTRVMPNMRRKYGIGGAVLACETGYPVVPVAHNAGSFWRRRGVIIHPGTIRISIGPVINSSGREPEAVRDEVEQWIETKMMELEGRSEFAELVRSRHPGKKS